MSTTKNAYAPILLAQCAGGNIRLYTQRQPVSFGHPTETDAYFFEFGKDTEPDYVYCTSRGEAYERYSLFLIATCSEREYPGEIRKAAIAIGKEFKESAIFTGKEYWSAKAKEHEKDCPKCKTPPFQCDRYEAITCHLNIDPREAAQ